jgi:hypothetical protein
VAIRAEKNHNIVFLKNAKLGENSSHNLHPTESQIDLAVLVAFYGQTLSWFEVCTHVSHNIY